MLAVLAFLLVINTLFNASSIMIMLCIINGIVLQINLKKDPTMYHFQQYKIHKINYMKYLKSYKNTSLVQVLKQKSSF